VQARTLCLSHVAPVVECEASTILVALHIVVKSSYFQVNFESDYQFVVNTITNGDAYVNELSIVLMGLSPLFQLVLVII
jgi:hypothetical protein